MALFLLKYLWVFILLPKSLQLVAYGAAFVVLLWKRNGQIHLSNSHKCFLMYGLVHILSIIYNCGIRSCEPDRIFAAVNTAMIWILAVLIAAMVSKEKIDVLKAGKYCLYNMLILIVMYFVPNIFKINEVNYILDTREIVSLDWINGSLTYRFSGLMEYSVLVALFGLLMIPLSTTYLTSTRKSFIIPFFLLSYFVIVKSNSRMGILLITMEVMLSLIYIMQRMRSLSTKAKRAIYVTVFLCGIVGILMLYPVVVQLIEKLFFMREGSNSQRFYIYSESIKATLKNSVILGCGVKDMIGAYPLGSHCSYIGFFYKTGILGSLFVLCGFWFLNAEYLKRFRSTKDFKILYFYFCQLILMLFFVTEDLDGANWLAASFFIIESVYVNYGNNISKNNSLRSIANDIS